MFYSAGAKINLRLGVEAGASSSLARMDRASASAFTFDFDVLISLILTRF